MYYLPNNVAIDVDAVIDGMLDKNIQIQYFLDIKTGDVVSAGEDDKVPKDTTRYFRILKIHYTSKEKWMKEFVRGLVYTENKKLAKELMERFEFTGLKGVYEYLEGYGEPWLDAWNQWEDDSAFDRLPDWFETLPVDVEDRWHGDDDCAVCRAMREGHDEEELLEAFAEQNERNETQPQYTEVAKSVEVVEKQLADIIEQYELTKKLSVKKVREWVLNETGDVMQSNKKYIQKWNSFFDTTPSNAEYQRIMDAFTDAWNYFPHKLLGGKSPREMYEQEK